MKHLLHVLPNDATYDVRAVLVPRTVGDSALTMTATPQRQMRKRPGFALRDLNVAGLIWQIAVIAIAVAIVAWLWSNALHNLSARRISTGFAFLGREAGMPIADSWIAYSPQNTYLRAFIVGVVNTLRIAVIGIV